MNWRASSFASSVRLSTVPETGSAQFIGDAKGKDAGESAAQRHLGLSFGDIAADFPGPGDWAPRPFLW
jgi:hypothetical protein